MTIKIFGKYRSLSRIIAALVIGTLVMVTDAAIDAEIRHNDQVVSHFLNK